MNGNEKHVVIVGAGFAGLFAVKKFFGRDVRVTLIDRNNYHAFNPLLYQVGAAEIEPDQIAYPLRTFIRGRKNIHFFMASVDAVKFKKNTIVTDRGEVNYDFLILAPGSSSGFFGIKGAEKNTMTLKSLDGALFLRNHIIEMFERATRCEDPEEREKCLSFVIVGGGPTGVEFAGAFAEFVSGPLRKDFAGIDTAEVRISLIDAAPGILGAYSGKSSAYAVKKLERMNIKVILNNSVKEVKADAIVLGGGGVIKSRTILWTAGVVGAALKSDVKLTDRRDRRVPVDQYLRPEGFDNVFICGDLALFMQQDLPLPMIAPVATQQGINAASNILRILKGRELKPFSYSDRGGMVTLGRNSAITGFAGFEFRGFVAWVLWIFIHIFYLIGFRNKLLVMLSWARDYLLYERSGKMIIPSDMKK